MGVGRRYPCTKAAISRRLYFDRSPGTSASLPRIFSAEAERCSSGCVDHRHVCEGVTSGHVATLDKTRSEDSSSERSVRVNPHRRPYPFDPIAGSTGVNPLPHVSSTSGYTERAQARAGPRRSECQCELRAHGPRTHSGSNDTVESSKKNIQHPTRFHFPANRLHGVLYA